MPLPDSLRILSKEEKRDRARTKAGQAAKSPPASKSSGKGSGGEFKQAAKYTKKFLAAKLGVSKKKASRKSEETYGNWHASELAKKISER